MESFGKIMAIVLGMIITPLINGFVLMKLWLWFVVPIFGLQPLRWVEAIGLMVIVNFITAKFDNNTKIDDFWLKFTNNIIFVFLLALFVLAAGSIVSFFM